MASASFSSAPSAAGPFLEIDEARIDFERGAQTLAGTLQWLKNNVAGWQTRTYGIEARVKWLERQHSSSFRDWRSTFDKSDAIDSAVETAERQRKQYMSRVQSVKSKGGWQDWDWTFPQNRTPPFWSIGLLKQMVTLSGATSEREAVLGKISFQVRKRLLNRASGMVRTPHAIVRDVDLVVKQVKSAATKEMQTAVNGDDDDERSLERGRGGMQQEDLEDRSAIPGEELLPNLDTSPPRPAQQQQQDDSAFPPSLSRSSALSFSTTPFFPPQGSAQSLFHSIMNDEPQTRSSSLPPPSQPHHQQCSSAILSLRSLGRQDYTGLAAHERRRHRQPHNHGSAIDAGAPSLPSPQQRQRDSMMSNNSSALQSSISREVLEFIERREMQARAAVLDAGPAERFARDEELQAARECRRQLEAFIRATWSPS